MRIELDALSTIPEVRTGDDLAALIREALVRERREVDKSVIVAIAQKIISKAENAIVDLRQLKPSAIAQAWANQWSKDARLIELILSRAKRVVKMDRGIIIAETQHGFVCANAGVDQSNTEGDDFATLLPDDPDASAQRLKADLGCGAVVITDTFGRPWREGLVDVAIGVSGLKPLIDLRGTTDRRGHKLTGTIIAVADQLAAAAGLHMEKSRGTPVVLIRGFQWHPADSNAKPLIRTPEHDLFR